LGAKHRLVGAIAPVLPPCFYVVTSLALTTWVIRGHLLAVDTVRRR